MTEKKTRRFHGLSLFLSITMLATCKGCGTNASSDGSSLSTQESSNSASACSSSESVSTSNKITDNGAPITDFDEFVNGEWKSQQEQGGVDAWYIEDKFFNESRDRILDILENTDLDSLDQESGLYKTIYVYRQLMDDDDYDSRIEAVSEFIKPIENVNSLDELYKLYESEEYSAFNALLNYNVGPDEYGYMVLYLAPCDVLNSSVRSDSNYEGYFDSVEKYCEKLGYSKERIETLFSNTVEISDLIVQYRNSIDSNSGYKYYFQENLDNEGITVPAISILEKQYETFCPEGFKGNNQCLLAFQEQIDLLKELYTEDNLEKLKDYLIYSAIDNLICASGEEIFPSDSSLSYSIVVFRDVVNNTPDIIAAEYQNRYLDEESLNELTTMAEDIKKTAMEEVNDVEWLSTYSKEQARAKILRLRFIYGHSEDYDDLKYLELTDNSVQNYISLLVSRRRYMLSQITKEDEEREYNTENTFQNNAYYYSEYNAVLLCCGLLCKEECVGDVSYEERLAHFGQIVAHEIFHSFDQKGYYFDRFGYYNEWLTEEEMEALGNKIDAIGCFYDGLEVEYGYTINGDYVKNESYADILSVECCLRLLAKQENPDYDAFFRAYANEKAIYYTKEGMEKAVADEHLPSKERINYILGQFDIFYDIYDIDENSQYYVPQDKRLHI